MKPAELKVLTEATIWYNRIEKAKTSTLEDETSHAEAIEEAEERLLKAVERLLNSK